MALLKQSCEEHLVQALNIRCTKLLPEYNIMLNDLRIDITKQLDFLTHSILVSISGYIASCERETIGFLEYECHNSWVSHLFATIKEKTKYYWLKNLSDKYIKIDVKQIAYTESMTRICPHTLMENKKEHITFLTGVKSIQ